MQPSVDLIWLEGSGPPPEWALGQVLRVAADPRSVCDLVEHELDGAEADAWLFWDGALGAPDASRVARALNRPGDLWHAGLRLGMSGLPGLLDFVSPTWMLNRDPDASIEATSWRLSLRACLVRTEVLRQMGGPRPAFETPEGAALEMGHRCVKRGVLTRHLPWLVDDGVRVIPPALPFEEELLFLHHRVGRFWTRWALARALLTGYVSPVVAFRALRRLKNVFVPQDPAPYAPKEEVAYEAGRGARVTVLVPTVDRYPYLETLLAQMGTQTVPPHEIIVVDQTPANRRDSHLPDRFMDLPLRVLYQEEPGQCSSRNAGIQASSGDHVLLLDDDVEVASTLLETHLCSLREHGADVSCGVAQEVGAGPLPEAFSYVRASDVCPAGNTMLKRSVLHRSGLFDLAYNRGQRADGDLGMRIYLSGAVMVLNPSISVLHHHAPSGGLRTHKARTVTYASSRQSLMQRHLPSVSECYLCRRYFTDRQRREALAIRVLGTLSVRGSLVRRALKAAIGLVCLPHTLRVIRQRDSAACAMLRTYPRIPAMGTEGEVGPEAVSGTR